MRSSKKGLEAHLFICTFQRESGECCGAKGSQTLRDAAKAMAKDPARGWGKRVRVNASGCLGRCEEGITAVLYPQGEWMVGLSSDSLPEIEQALSRALDRKDSL